MDNLTDNQLIALYLEGSQDAFRCIYERYKPMMISIINKSDYHLVNGDINDLMQEGLLGLLKAVNTYVASENTKFSSFAYLCMQSSIKTAITKSLTLGNQPLNNAVSIDEMPENTQLTVDIEKKIIDIEDEQAREEKLKTELSKKEYAVLKLYLLGMTYDEMANILDVDKKSIDNTIQRIKKKLSK